MSKKRDSKKEVVGLLGVGLDNQDGHHRLTRGEFFFLVGGSQETHEHMQDTALRFTEALHKRGKRLPETSPEEVIDLWHEASEE